MKNVTFLLLAGLLLAACKRHDTFNDLQPNTDRVLAEFTDARSGTTVTREFSPDVIAVDLTELRLDPRSVTGEATTVKVTVNPALVSQYNLANGTSYTPVLAAAFSLEPEEYTLTPGKRKVMVRGLLNPSSILNGSYALGLAIAEVKGGEISNIGRNVIVFLSIKNQYDGIYSLKGYSNIPSSAFTGNFDVPCSEELAAVTAGASAVALDPAQPVANGGSFTYITNLLPEIRLNPQTGQVSAVVARTGGIDLIYPYDPTYNSRYEPQTKTIYVKYGVAPAGSGRYIIDTLRFCRPR